MREHAETSFLDIHLERVRGLYSAMIMSAVVDIWRKNEDYSEVFASQWV